MKTAGNWQREHNQRAARTLEQKQRSTLAIAKAMRVPFVVGTGPVPTWLRFRRDDGVAATERRGYRGGYSNTYRRAA